MDWMLFGATISIPEVCQLFESKQKTHRIYPVIDGTGMLVGIVSRGDVLNWQGDPDLGELTLTESVSDASVPVGHPEDTVGFIADVMLSTDAGRIPIVDPTSGKLCGLIARKDLLRLRSSLRTSEFERRPYISRRVGDQGANGRQL
jgi:chloride channel protein, CIC family